MKRKHSISTTRLVARRQASMKKLARLGPVLRGSLVTAKRGRHLAHQLTLSVNGKTHTVYVPAGMVKEAQEWIRNYRQLQRLIRDQSKLNLAIIHRYIPENRGADSRRRPRRRIR
jgi:hypothetical protein